MCGWFNYYWFGVHKCVKYTKGQALFIEWWALFGIGLCHWFMHHGAFKWFAKVHMLDKMFACSALYIMACYLALSSLNPCPGGPPKMLWSHPATPASKLYADGKLSLRAPDGTVFAMQDLFQEDETGYQAWLTKLVPILHLGGLLVPHDCGVRVWTDILFVFCSGASSNVYYVYPWLITQWALLLPY